VQKDVASGGELGMRAFGGIKKISTKKTGDQNRDSRASLKQKKLTQKKKWTSAPVKKN